MTEHTPTTEYTPLAAYTPARLRITCTYQTTSNSVPESIDIEFNDPGLPVTGALVGEVVAYLLDPSMAKHRFQPAAPSRTVDQPNGGWLSSTSGGAGTFTVPTASSFTATGPATIVDLPTTPNGEVQ